MRLHLAGLVVAALVGGCLRLPPDLVYRVQVSPDAGLLQGESYYYDTEDSTTVFETEGLRVKAKHLNDAALNQELARYTYREPNLNPFTYGADRDLDRGYTPPRFTVFQVTLVNLNLPKTKLDPARVVLHTDRGGTYPAWTVQQRDGPNSFERYYMERRGEGGNESYYFQERMGLVRQALFRRDTWVWRGESYTGKLVFAPLHEDVRQVRLWIGGIVVRVDAFDRPTESVDADFAFGVEQGVIEAEEPREALESGEN